MLDFEERALLEEVAGLWDDRIAYVGGDARERLGLSALLVRPDGIVAWVGEGTPDLEDAAQAAARWFGEPTEREAVALPTTRTSRSAELRAGAIPKQTS